MPILLDISSVHSPSPFSPERGDGVKHLFAISVFLICSGCDAFQQSLDPDNYRAFADSNVWASKNDILAAGAKCVESNIKPRQVGETGAWAVDTKDRKFISSAKSLCIHNELNSQNLLVTK